MMSTYNRALRALATLEQFPQERALSQRLRVAFRGDDESQLLAATVQAEVALKRFDPRERRDERGRWTSGGSSERAQPATDVATALAQDKHTVCSIGQLPDVIEQIKSTDVPEGHAGINLSNLHVATADHGNLFDYSATDLPREAMPVVPADRKDAQHFAAHMRKQGIKARIRRVKPSDLHATQNQLDGKKVAGIKGWADSDPKGFADKVLVIARDGAVLDGHHRWAAGVLHELTEDSAFQVNVLQCDADIKDLLDAGWAFDQQHGLAGKPFGQKARTVGDGYSEFVDDPGQPPDNRQPWVWFGGRWVMLASDDDDGVPRKLNVGDKDVVNTELDSEAG